MVSSLDRQIALVTGGGGGIGRAIAAALAHRGAHVAVNYRRNRAGAEAVCAEIAAAGRIASAFQADVTDPEQIKSMVCAVERRFGRIDILVNNAGDLVERRKLADMDAALFRHILDLNVISAFLCSQAVAKGMISRGHGSIVMMASLAAHNGGGPGAFAYAAAKAAVIAMAKGLAKELAPTVRVNCVSPGLIGGTDFHARFTPADAFAAAEKTAALARAGTPEEVASVVAFLAGSESSYLTGETIETNGGMFMR